MENSREHQRSFRRWQMELPLRPTQPVAYDADAEEAAKELCRKEREARKGR